MATLNEAIKDQIVNTLQRNEPADNSSPAVNDEVNNLLQAFIALINAYLQRVSEPTPPASRTFGTLG